MSKQKKSSRKRIDGAADANKVPQGNTSAPVVDMVSISRYEHEELKRRIHPNTAVFQKTVYADGTIIERTLNHNS